MFGDQINLDAMTIAELKRQVEARSLATGGTQNQLQICLGQASRGILGGDFLGGASEGEFQERDEKPDGLRNSVIPLARQTPSPG